MPDKKKKVPQDNQPRGGDATTEPPRPIPVRAAAAMSISMDDDVAGVKQPGSEGGTPG